MNLRSGVQSVAEMAATLQHVSRPPGATYSPDPDYDEASRKQKVEGTVVLQITVKKNGLVKDPRINRGLCEALDKRAVETVSKWKFTPATKYGKPVAVRLIVEVVYKLD